jgi:proteic killer suppression protein
MIKNFRDAATEELFRTGKSRHFPTEIHRSGHRRLRELDAATSLNDLRGEGKKLERYKDGRYSIRVNDKYRVLFQWEQPNAYDVHITNPHKG